MWKRMLITGASTGIGAATAKLLAHKNELILHYNSSEEEAEEVAAFVEKQGGKGYLIQADLSTEKGTKLLFDKCANQFDSLDVLINNAGSLVERKTAGELEWDLMEYSFRLNVFSVMKLSSLCLPLLEKGEDPQIINITSIAMRHGSPTATIYGATKGALDSFTRGLASEMAPAIRVNAVAPGVIATPFHERFSTPERMEKFRESTPLKRNGKPRHIATAIRFLLENDFITGETIDVNGGLFMR